MTKAPSTAAFKPTNLEPPRSPSTRARQDLLLDNLPRTLKLKKPPLPLAPSQPEVANEYLAMAPLAPASNKRRPVAETKSFKQVISQIKLLDTSKSCRLL